MGCNCKHIKNVDELNYTIVENILANNLTFFQRLKILWYELKFKLKRQ